MPPKTISLFLLVTIGAMGAVLLAPRLQKVAPARLARGFLVAVTALMGVRVAAYFAANVFGMMAVRPLSAGPYDLTNLLVGSLYGVALMRTKRGTFDGFLRHPDVLLALKVATGIGFVLAGLVNVFFPDLGVDYFVAVGYPESFRFFILTAEVLGGAALLLPWRWLTLAVASGLTIDMFGALTTQIRTGDTLDAAAFAMLLRLAPLVVLSVTGQGRRRWASIGAGAIACAAVAVVGSVVLMDHG